jgi:hypothetical protein
LDFFSSLSKEISEEFLGIEKLDLNDLLNNLIAILKAD